MKNTVKIIGSLVVILVFLYMNWASTRSMTYTTMNTNASIYQDSLIILENNDSISILDAMITIAVSEPNETYDELYFLEEYSLSSFTVDTLVIKNFKDVYGVPYRTNLLPHSLSFAFQIPDEDIIVNNFQDF